MLKQNKWMIIFSCLILTLTAGLLWFKIVYNSDILFLDSLANDLFYLGGEWSDWRLTPAPAYFPDMLLYFFAYKILPNAAARIFFVSVAQIFILALTAVWVSKQIYPKISNGASALLLLLIAFTTFVASHSGMWLYFYTANNHFAALVLSLICVGLIIRFYAKPSFLKAIFIIFVGSIAKASTAIYFISFLAPAFCLWCLVFIIAFNSRHSQKIHLNRIVWIFILFTISYVASLLIDLFLTYNNPLDGRLPVTFGAARHSFSLFLQATSSAFSLHTKVTFIFSSLILVALFFLVHRLLKGIRRKENSAYFSTLVKEEINQENWRVILSCVFLFIVIPVNIFGMICSGGFIDIAGYRYLSFPIALVLILSVIVGDRLELFSSRLWKIIFILICLLLIIFSIRGYKNAVSHAFVAPPLVKCLISIEKQGFDLKEGVADYWNARGISVYLPRKNEIQATLNNMDPFFWMSTLGPIYQRKNYQYHYNFLILHNSTSGGQFDYTPKTIGKLVPQPSSIYKCDEADEEIWLYSNNELDMTIKSAFSRFLFSRNQVDNDQVDA